MLDEILDLDHDVHARDHLDPIAWGWHYVRRPSGNA
jgi:hypothetical protein